MNKSQSDPRLQALLSGYATGNLTEQEREELFTAALVDQSLFDALMREEALREMVEQPVVRAQLLAAVSEPSLGARLAAWWRRPMAWGVTGAAVAVATLVMVVAVSRQPEVRYSSRVPQAEAPMAMPDPAPAPEVRAEQPLAERAPKRERVANSDSSPRQKPLVRDSAVGAEKEKNEMAAAPPQAAAMAREEEVAGLEKKDEPPVAQSLSPAPARAVAEADTAAVAGPRLADAEQRRQSMAKTAAPASPAATQAAAMRVALQVRNADGAFMAASGLAADSGAVRVAVVAPENGFVRMELRSGENGVVRRVSIVAVSGGQTALVPSTEGIAAGVGDVLSLQFARDARSFGILAPGAQGFRSGLGGVGRVEIPIARAP